MSILQFNKCSLLPQSLLLSLSASPSLSLPFYSPCPNDLQDYMDANEQPRTIIIQNNLHIFHHHPPPPPYHSPLPPPALPIALPFLPPPPLPMHPPLTSLSSRLFIHSSSSLDIKSRSRFVMLLTTYLAIHILIHINILNT